LLVTQPQPATLNASTSSFSLLGSRSPLANSPSSPQAQPATYPRRQARRLLNRLSSRSPPLFSRLLTSALHLCTSALRISPTLLVSLSKTPTQLTELSFSLTR
ncbi:hypothetical protein PanWU01x14_180300, partial [Parasponia andersonii]